MTSSRLILTVLLAVAFQAAPGLTGDLPEATAKEVAPTAQIPYSPEAALTEIETEYGLWLEEVLDGDEGRAHGYERDLMRMVGYDVILSQEAVRRIAKQAALTSDHAESEPAAEDVRAAPKQLDFQRAVAHLRAKEAIYRALSHTDAFSNKYRLLGDYIDLLRRELDMPKLMLARTGNDMAVTENSAEANAATE
jgi:hypothetical protein